MPGLTKAEHQGELARHTERNIKREVARHTERNINSEIARDTEAAPVRPNFWGTGGGPLQHDEPSQPVSTRFRAFCVPMVCIGKRWASAAAFATRTTPGAAPNSQSRRLSRSRHPGGQKAARCDNLATLCYKR